MTNGTLDNSDKMVDMYVTLVRNGLPLAKVPVKYRERVRAIVEGNKE